MHTCLQVGELPPVSAVHLGKLRLRDSLPSEHLCPRGLHLAQASMCLLLGRDYKFQVWLLRRVPAFLGAVCPSGSIGQGTLTLLGWAPPS